MKIAMVGKYCNTASNPDIKQGAVFSGGGSGFVTTRRTVTPMQGMQDRVGDAAALTWSEDASAGEGADVAIVCVAEHAEEGWDREHFAIPNAWKLVEALRSQSDDIKIVVLLVIPGEVTTPWMPQADAALALFMP